ncbi:MAG: hypothetical protein EB833_00420 [Thaumarchaeota archaeon S13]|nr:MAG: hypothetical protein EB833_00420 [Thaumarchaeota archaeon S13]
MQKWRRACGAPARRGLWTPVARPGGLGPGGLGPGGLGPGGLALRARPAGAVHHLRRRAS